MWNGRQIVSEEWIQEATRRQVELPEGEAHGYKWWFPREPQGLYEARGRGGERIAIFPPQQLVVVLTGIAEFDPGEIGALLLPAVKSGGPLPPLPALARQISVKTLVVEGNPIGLKTMQLVFAGLGDSGRDLAHRECNRAVAPDL
ncbi:MAG: hypothetical protein AAB225_27650 [Acidobacteriota bacterium]